MNSSERMNAAIYLKPVDRVPNAPFYEAPICRYFGADFRSALLGDQAMADAHLTALDELKFDWVIVGMGLIGGIIPEALGCKVSYPENVFPVIEQTLLHLKKASGMSGYIFSTSGTTSPATPRENFEAMNREVRNFDWS